MVWAVDGAHVADAANAVPARQTSNKRAAVERIHVSDMTDGRADG
jgi:hypothetical protein